MEFEIPQGALEQREARDNRSGPRVFRGGVAFSMQTHPPTLDPQHVMLAQGMWLKWRNQYATDDLVVTLWVNQQQGVIHVRDELIAKFATPTTDFGRGLLSILKAGPTRAGTFRVVVLESQGDAGTLMTGEVPIPTIPTIPTPDRRTLN